MKLISGQSYFVKKVFPALWLGILFLITSMVLLSGERTLQLIAVGVAAIFGLVGYFFFKNFYWNLADEVYDQGGHLLCKMNGKEQIIRFSEIDYLSHIITRSPEKVELHLRKDSGLGKVVAFILPVRSNRSSENTLVTDLKERIGRAKKLDQHNRSEA